MSFLRPLRNQAGSAILFSVFLMSLLLFIAMEISKDTIVEYQASLNSVKRVQAYYAAKSCNEISMLRIKAYQQATRALGNSLPDPSLLDMIWQFPLSWPVVAPPELAEGDKSIIQQSMAASTFKHKFSSKIVSESSKIDVNDLGSSSEAIRNKAQQQLLQLFQSKLNEQSEWSTKYANFRFEDLIKHMADWIDADRTSLLGGDERSYYSDISSQYIPPNQPFKTKEELHMVKLMEDDIYDVIAPSITLYGGKGINVNYADKDLLIAIDPQITKETADEILKRRSDPNLGGPFKNEKDFMNFIGGFGVNASSFNPEKIPLYFDPEINFHVSCIGVVGNITREITSVVYDFQTVQSRLQKNMTEDPNDACKGLEGNAKHQCQCQSQTDQAAKTKCIQDKQKADQAQSSNQGPAPALPPGSPYIIFRDVK